jgi:hypothetical protein
MTAGEAFNSRTAYGLLHGLRDRDIAPDSGSRPQTGAGGSNPPSATALNPESFQETQCINYSKTPTFKRSSWC